MGRGENSYSFSYIDPYTLLHDVYSEYTLKSKEKKKKQDP